MMLANRTVLVTGATAGIGQALTRQLADYCHTVIAVGRRRDHLDAMAQEYPNVIAMPCDLTSKHGVMTLAKKIERDGLPVSVLINNAGIQYYPRFTDPDFSFDGIEREIATNFTAPAWLISLLLPTLLDQKTDAAIVNISSGLAIYPKTSSAIYSATKAALHSFSQSLRYQLEGTPVRVCEVLLPLVDTDMVVGREGRKISAKETADAIINAIRNDKDEHYVGIARLLPFLARLSPALTKKILKAS